MKPSRFKPSLLAIGIVVACVLSAGQSAAAVLYTDDMSNGAGWGINASSADSSATFGYDYSADFIQEAPNSQVGDAATTGVKLSANLTAVIGDSLIIYPLGQNFTGSYQLRFDAWMNYDVHSRINGSSAGTTEFLGGGVGYDNSANDIGNGIQVLATGDGGSGSDWRAFDEGAFFDATAMAAGSRNGADPYYSGFLPGVAPPAGQAQVSFPNGTDGSPGFQWITWQLTVDTLLDQVLVDIEKPDHSLLRIISIDCLGLTIICNTDGNIGLMYADFFSSVTSRPDLTFGIIDNVLVSTQDRDNEVPLPGTLTLIGLGLAGLGFARRKKA